MDIPQISTNNNFQSLFHQHCQTSFELRKSSISDRKQKLRHLIKWISAHQLDLHEAEYLDLRKPQDEVNVTELYPLISEARQTIAHLSSWASPKTVKSSLSYFGTRSSIHYEPKGTSLIIAPWNYPLLLAIGPLISAIAAGCTVILKPSEFTPATNKVLLRMITELYDEREVTMVEGEADVSSALLAFPFDHIFFTGSPQVGKIVMAAAAKNLSSVTLELGGKSPTIVDETAAVKDAALKLSWAKWTNAGQTCVAPDYLFVHETVKDQFIKEFISATRRMYGQKDNYASIINEKHFDRLNETIADALDKGAKLIEGGKVSSETLDIQPIVMEDIADDMRLMNEEIFGPILPIKTYSDLDEVIDFVNQRPKPLALYLFSRSKKNKQWILEQTSSGSLVFNDSVLHFGHPHLAVGGVNNSGIGKAHGHAGFLAFSHEKSVMSQQIGLTVASTVRPPYSTLKKKLIQFMLKYL